MPYLALTASIAADVYLDDEVNVEAGDITTGECCHIGGQLTSLLPGVVENWYLGDTNFQRELARTYCSSRGPWRDDLQFKLCSYRDIRCRYMDDFGD